MSTSRKRSFQEMLGTEPDANRSDKKRPNIETKGRRLFSPTEPSTSRINIDISYFDGSSKMLTTILEELDSPSSKNFHNLSPSPVKRQLNILKSPENVRLNKFTSPFISKDRSAPPLNSPTTNLPNFVVDGDAPHLGLMSPQRKIKKENVDWLTKMRKQKLLSLNSTLDKDKGINSAQQENNDVFTDKLKSIENKAEAQDLKKTQNKNGTTILKFFALKVPPENV